MTRWTLAALFLAGLLLGGCSDDAKRLIRTEPPKLNLAGDTANPEAAPPPVQVKVSEQLPVVEAPAGIITQTEAQNKAVAAMENRKWGGLLLLTELKFDALNKGWEAAFQTDGRIPDRPRSHPYERLSDDPVQQRKLEHSWVSVAAELHVFIDGVSGEVRGGGFSGGKVQPARPDLEHYRGRIIDGGEVTRLQLTRVDGAPVGREIDVWVPQDLLGADLALWHLQYGHGRLVEVWGLTAAPGVVVAHRISMADLPPESLLAAPLADGLPIYPGAYIRPGDEKSTVLQTKGADAAAVRAWYLAQLPAYGWALTSTTDTYESVTGEKVRMTLAPQENGAVVTFTHLE